jgi:DNA polymerase-4
MQEPDLSLFAGEVPRKIIHVDMDAFYASVEILDHPDFAKLPLVVGGDPTGRGVVCAASYRAREFGIRSAMPCSRAKSLCPGALFVRPRFDRYREISAMIHGIFHRYTDLIEPLSLDEAWLDVTENKKDIPSGTIIGKQIQKAIALETGLSCSVGVSYNKFLAKMASEENKPAGLFVIPPHDAREFLKKKKVKEFPGVGPVTAAKLERTGVQTGNELQNLNLDTLVSQFGQFGIYLYRIVRGRDDRLVHADSERKQISVEDTFPDDLFYGEALIKELEHLRIRLESRVKKAHVYGTTLQIKVKFSNFDSITRSIAMDRCTGGKESFDAALELLQSVFEEYPDARIRLLGIGVAGLHEVERTLFSFPVKDSRKKE